MSNRRNRQLSADVKLNKNTILLRNVTNTIQQRNIPRSVRPGAIE